jgi:hypothetical protein
MSQEAETGLQTLDRWRGEPLTLCGHVYRWDVDPVPAGQPRGTWQERRDQETRRAWARYTGEQLRKHVPGLQEQDPVYPEAQRWVTAGGWTPWLDCGRAVLLGQYWGLAEELLDSGLMPAGYSLGSWALATAQQSVGNAESFERVRGELRAEIASHGRHAIRS